MLTPERVRAEVAEFCVMPVTFGPMTELIVIVPVPVPELEIVPVWLMVPVLILIAEPR